MSTKEVRLGEWEEEGERTKTRSFHENKLTRSKNGLKGKGQKGWNARRKDVTILAKM